MDLHAAFQAGRVFQGDGADVFPVQVLVNLESVGFVTVPRCQCLAQRWEGVAVDQDNRAMNLDNAADWFRLVCVVFRDGFHLMNLCGYVWINGVLWPVLESVPCNTIVSPTTGMARKAGEVAMILNDPGVAGFLFPWRTFFVLSWVCGFFGVDKEFAVK